MASFYADPALGGSGSTYTDDTNPTTGLDNYGYTERLIPMFTDVAGIANYAKGRATAADASATAAAASAASALGAPGTNATSTTSLTVGTGSKSLTLAQTGKAFSIGQVVVIASTASPGNQMTGIITAFNSGTGAMTVDVQQTLGSGTIASWTISLGALVSSTLPSQTGNSGKFLTTNGTSASWANALIPGNNLSDVSNTTTARSNLGLAIGTNVQAYDADLAAIAALVSAANKLPYATGASTWAMTDLSAFGRSLIDDADAATARATLGLVIDTNVQAYSAKTAALAGLTWAADKGILLTGASTASTFDLTAYARTLLDDANAGAARGTLGAAASGANTDITSLGGLTTAGAKAVVAGALPAYAGNAGRLLAVKGDESEVEFVRPVMAGYATISGTTLTERYSNGFLIGRVSTGLYYIQLDAAAANSVSWHAAVMAGYSGVSNAYTVSERTDGTKTASIVYFEVRNNGGSLTDPESLSAFVFVNA